MKTIHLTIQEANTLANLLKDAAIPQLERQLEYQRSIAGTGDMVATLEAELERRRAVLAKLEAGEGV